jgi:tRNA (cmo5U34)-methyltransferase
MRNVTTKQPVGDGIVTENASWSFAGIGETFTDHVRRSVPLYDEGHDLMS